MMIIIILGPKLMGLGLRHSDDDNDGDKDGDDGGEEDHNHNRNHHRW